MVQVSLSSPRSRGISQFNPATVRHVCEPVLPFDAATSHLFGSRSSGLSVSPRLE